MTDDELDLTPTDDLIEAIDRRSDAYIVIQLTLTAKGRGYSICLGGESKDIRFMHARLSQKIAALEESHPDPEDEP